MQRLSLLTSLFRSRTHDYQTWSIIWNHNHVLEVILLLSIETLYSFPSPYSQIKAGVRDIKSKSHFETFSLLKSVYISGKTHFIPSAQYLRLPAVQERSSFTFFQYSANYIYLLSVKFLPCPKRTRLWRMQIRDGHSDLFWLFGFMHTFSTA